MVKIQCNQENFDIIFRLLKKVLADKEVCLGSLNRELGSIAKEMSIPVEKLKSIIKAVIHELVDEL